MPGKFTGFTLYVTLLLHISVSLTFAKTQATARSGAIEGVVIHAETGEPLGMVNLLLHEIDAGTSSHLNGEFHLYRIPPGNYTLSATRLGFRENSQLVKVSKNDTVSIKILLTPSLLSLRDVEFSVENQDEGIRHDPVTDLGGGDLQRELGTTIAETVSEEAGISQRSMGPAPARPVLRGLGGDRLLIVEDGRPTGDLSSTSADHAVAIDPMTAGEIEVIRGPETFVYGSGALGGVVNVKRDAIVTNPPHRAQGRATLEGESVNSGLSGGGELIVPAGDFALRVDGSLRVASDMNTPEGKLDNTSITTLNGSMGVSYLPEWGYAGIAVSGYNTEYGIPGGFVGAHPNGIDIQMERQNVAFISRRYFSQSYLKHVDIDYSFARYYHAEFESSGSLGMEFGVLSHQLGVQLHTAPHLGFSRGVIGVEIRTRDYATGGLTFTPSTNETQSSVFLYERREWSRFHINAAARVELKNITPDEQYFSRTLNGNIEDRNFSGWSGSIAGEYYIDRIHRLGVNFTRTFRPPGVEELFSLGPHLAAYSYEKGNPVLSPETGAGSEVYLRIHGTRTNARSAIFVNYINGYIFPQNTGKFSSRRADLYEYRYKGLDAVMFGGELSVDLQVTDAWSLFTSGSYVQGELVETGTPLPQIPPLSGKLGSTFNVNGWSTTMELLGASQQNRLGEFETPTAGWLRLDVTLQYQHIWYGMLHSIVLASENLTDSPYRSHLSRIKVVMPEPGRNIKLIYRVYF
ncbi:TonB-dependent receptor [bacterium]|nr:TonB-dependent receptor [bacterium]